MSHTLVRGGAALGAVAVAAFLLAGRSGGSNAAPAAEFPTPALDASLATAKGRQTAVLSGGCFWGMQLVFEHVKGVINVESGYAGGTTGNTALMAEDAMGFTLADSRMPGVPLRMPLVVKKGS